MDRTARRGHARGARVPARLSPRPGDRRGDPGPPRGLPTPDRDGMALARGPREGRLHPEGRRREPGRDGGDRGGHEGGGSSHDARRDRRLQRLVRHRLLVAEGEGQGRIEGPGSTQGRMQLVHRHRLRHRRRQGRARPQHLVRLPDRRRQRDPRPEAGEGTPHPDAGASRLDPQRHRLLRHRRGPRGLGDDDRRLHRLRREGHPGVRPHAARHPGRLVDRRVVRGHEEGQQRRLRQRLAPGRRQHQRDRAPRAGARSTWPSRRRRTASSSARTSPRT